MIIKRELSSLGFCFGPDALCLDPAEGLCVAVRKILGHHANPHNAERRASPGIKQTVPPDHHVEEDACMRQKDVDRHPHCGVLVVVGIA
jgi:hypothetical protein